VLEEEQIEQVAVGMTRSQVQFLLGTPMIADPFHPERWDYPSYLRRGRSDDVQQSWTIVYFENDRVTRIERDRTLDPGF
jgi:outer membrane protein assembly factor BamE